MTLNLFKENNAVWISRIYLKDTIGKIVQFKVKSIH